MKLRSVNVLPDNKAVEIVWDNGSRARFHAVWLRDNALDDQTRSPINGQRMITLLDIPQNLTITNASITDEDCMRISIAPENRVLDFPASWLNTYAYDKSGGNRLAGWVNHDVETWDSTLQDRITAGEWQQVSSSREALGHWLAGVRKFGFAVLSGVPTGSGDLCQIADLFGYVRETNYGRWFDVRAEVNPTNLAYTNLGLQAHTDNPYRDPVPTLQILSCLENSVDGGDSIVVDGFRVAERMRAENQKGFDLLSQYRANFEYAGSEGVRLRSRQSVIKLTPDGELGAICFNNRSAAPLTGVPFELMEAYYAASRQFAEIVEDKSMEVTFKLSAGELFIVDNTRILHARKAFSGTGERWLQGCYADKDGLLSTLADIEGKQQGYSA